jgi:Spy/CpxP family protein refolding chaperone
MAVDGPEDPKPRPRWAEGRRHRERLSSKLKLSPEQTEMLSASRAQLFDEFRAVKGRLQEESDALAGLLTAAELDMDAVSEQVEKVAALRNEIQWQMIRHILSIREMLEPEQLESLRDFAGRMLSQSGRGGRHRGKPPARDGDGPCADPPGGRRGGPGESMADETGNGG